MEVRQLHVILLSSLVAAAAGGIAAIVVTPRGSVERSGPPSTQPTPVDAALARIEARQAELERALADLRDSMDTSAGTRSEIVDIDGAIARWMEAHGPKLALPSGEERAAASVSKQERLAQVIAKLRTDELSEVDAQRLWRELAKEGLEEDVLAEFERQAELDPDNADLKVELAGIYFLKLTEVGSSPEAGLWATKADKLLDSALELDANHWDARFSKAVALSFWPPVYGKQKEAISHFETLVAQQAVQPKRDDFAQTHLLLGNMYQQIGDTEKAVAAWQAGLAQFPTDEELKKQLDLYAAD